MQVDDIKQLMTRSECLVPHGTEMNGTVHTDADLIFRVDGKFEGELTIASGGTVLISQSAEVTSQIVMADCIVVEGSVTGELHARKNLILTSTCALKGLAKYGESISVQPRARIHGELQDTSWV